MNIKNTIIASVIFAVIFLGLSYVGEKTRVVGRGTDVSATIATTSNPLVGTTAVTLFATSTCVARVITTYANPIMLTFSNYAAQTPTGTFGHLQTASTTVVYDSTQFGCGLVKVYGYTADTQITVSESR